jgi:hypothetical protein
MANVAFSAGILVGVALLAIEEDNPINQKVEKFFSNSLDNFALSADIGQDLLVMNLISLNDTVEKVCNDKPIMNWITDKFTNSLSDDFNTSTFGKPFEISDKAIYFQCRGDAYE